MKIFIKCLSAVALAVLMGLPVVAVADSDHKQLPDSHSMPTLMAANSQKRKS
jgi:hypothetical protein